MVLISRRIANAASSQVLRTSGQFVREWLSFLHACNIITSMLLFSPEEAGPGDYVHEPWLLVQSRNNVREEVIDEEEESGSSMIRATLHKINAWKARHSTYFLQDKKALRMKLQERAEKIAEMVNAAEETARILDDLEQKVDALEDHVDKAEARIQALEASTWLCLICTEPKPDVVFSCGHVGHVVCMKDLQQCILCRKKICFCLRIYF